MSRRRRELALIKWRDVVDGPAQVLEDVTRLRGGEDPDRLGARSTTRGRRCNGTLTFDPDRIPDPAGADPAGPRAGRALHALGLAEGARAPTATRARARSAPPDQHDARPHASRASSPSSSARLRAARRARGRRRQGATAATRSISSGRRPSLDERLPAALRARRDGRAAGADAARSSAPATMGSQRVVPGLWAGDQPSDVRRPPARDRRRRRPPAMSGFPTWGSDVGGYSLGRARPASCSRAGRSSARSRRSWRSAAQGANATPWTLGAGAMARAARRRPSSTTSSSPTSTACSQRGEPVLRPLGYGFPDDAQSWQADLELLVGPDLLAAPVTGAGHDAERLPAAGLWVDLYTGATVKGGRALHARDAARRVPALRARRRRRAVQPAHGAGSWWGMDELSHPGRAGFLVDDGAELDLRGQPRDVQLFVPAPARPARRHARRASRSPGAGTRGRCRGSSSACTARPCGARSCSPAPRMLQCMSVAAVGNRRCRRRGRPLRAAVPAHAAAR